MGLGCVVEGHSLAYQAGTPVEVDGWRHRATQWHGELTREFADLMQDVVLVQSHPFPEMSAISWR